MNTQNLEQRLTTRFNCVRLCNFMEAMTEFYDKDVTMQENANPPTIGLAANIEREQQVLSGVKEWKGFTVTASAAGHNVTFYECSMDFVTTGGQLVHTEQVVVARWLNGKIVHERYYYDSGMKK